jgi:cystathionine beta-synthase
MADKLDGVRYAETILDTIGRTPLVRLGKVGRGLKPYLLAKVESFNPGSSVKDRIGRGILEEAEREGRLKPGGTVVEATSGNTGLGLAIAAAVKGYHCVFTMPDKMSKEKIQILRSFGAEVIVTPTAVPHDSPESYTEVAKRIVRETPNAILADQYNNPRNPQAHYETTGPELWEQTGGKIDCFVCAIGTGGTITGTGRYLKERNPRVRVVGVDPKGSVFHEFFYTKQYPETIKTYLVEGIGQDYIPNTVDFSVVDEIVQVDDRESFQCARRLTREEGIFAGGSAGSALAGALAYADRLDAGDLMVVLLPDTGERYLSKLYNDDWMRENRMLAPEKVTLRYILERKTDVPQLVTIDPATSIKEAMSVLRSQNFYQLPVFENGKPVGSVIENDLMGAVMEDPRVFDTPVRELMRAPFPVLPIGAPLTDAIARLSQRSLAVLVEEENAVVGILTKFDVIEYLSQ